MIMNAYDARLRTDAAIKSLASQHRQRINILYHSILKAVENVADIGGTNVCILWASKAEAMGIFQAITHTTHDGNPALIVSDRARLYIKCVPDVKERLMQAGFAVAMGRNDDGNPTISRVSW